MKGTVVKGIGGFYYVKTADGTHQCKARGIFKKRGISPAVGDEVEIQPAADGDAVLTEIHPRKNIFIRPPIANVDCFVVVLAAADPMPNLSITDKFLVMAEKSRTDIILCINKADLATAEAIEEIEMVYRPIYPVVAVSAKNDTGIEGLKNQLSGKKSALAGPSGVGKSTLLNKLASEFLAETGTISGKTKRGKHTTRHSQLFDIGKGAMLFDTPGFSSFDIMDASEEELQFLYPEMEPFTGQCKYDNCRHLKEPGCAVRSALDHGEIFKSRYDSYLSQMIEIKQKRKY